MKKIYKRPMMQLVNIETSNFIAASPELRWIVDKNNEPAYTEDTPHWGPINYDKGKDNYPSANDPWNSDNW